VTAEPRTIFTLRIACPAGQEGVHRLRALLKDLLRRHQFHALDVREESDAAAGDVNTITEETTAQLPADHLAPTGE
jgi:hypothetical protein